MIDDFSNFDAACNGDDNRANETAASKARTQSADNDDDISQMIEHLEVDKASRDLLVRLLERSPQHRLKSLLALKRVAFFHNFNFDDIRHMKVSELRTTHTCYLVFRGKRVICRRSVAVAQRMRNYISDSTSTQLNCTTIDDKRNDTR